MPLALTPYETWKYQLVEDRLPGPDGSRTKDSKLDKAKTIWGMRSVPAKVHAMVTDAIELAEGSICLNRGTVMRLLLEHGIDSVENWYDEKGNTITLKKRTVDGREVVDLEFLDRLTPEQRAELSNAVERREKVTPDEGN